MTFPRKPRIIMEWIENGQTMTCEMPFDESTLYSWAQGGSAHAKNMFRSAINDQLVEPLIERILEPLLTREREGREREAIFGPGPITPASMERAVRSLAKQRRDDEEPQG